MIGAKASWGVQMKRLTIENFRDEIIECARPCLVLFKNKHCGLCDGMISVMFRIKAAYGSKVKIGYVETTQEEGVSDMFEIEGVPTLFFFRDGDGVELEYPARPDIYSGYSEKHVRDHLDKLL